MEDIFKFIAFSYYLNNQKRCQCHCQWQSGNQTAQLPTNQLIQPPPHQPVHQPILPCHPPPQQPVHQPILPCHPPPHQPVHQPMLPSQPPTNFSPSQLQFQQNFPPQSQFHQTFLPSQPAIDSSQPAINPSSQQSGRAVQPQSPPYTYLGPAHPFPPNQTQKSQKRKLEHYLIDECAKKRVKSDDVKERVATKSSDDVGQLYDELIGLDPQPSGSEVSNR